MNDAAKIALIRLVLTYVADTKTMPNFGTPDLVDGHGFRVTELTRFREVAIDRFWATPDQAMAACLHWVASHGRTYDPDTLPRLVKAAA